jgi:POT family proton-dependent oligopeptide transporter
VCSLLGEGYNYHWGFSAAGFGMILGLVQYRLGGRYLGSAGALRTGEVGEVLARRNRNFYLTLGAFGAIALVVGLLVSNGTIPFGLQAFATGLGYAIIAITILYFVYLLAAGGYDAPQKRRLLGIFWIFILAAIFWSGFEQAGSSMNLFARDLTDRQLGPYPGFGTMLALVVTLAVAVGLGFAVWKLWKRRDLYTLEKAIAAGISAGLVVFTYWVLDQIAGGWEMPAGWLQNINPIFIVLLAPVFGTMWVSLARRNANPSIPMKFALGLLGLSAGFFVLSWGAANAVPGQVSMAWLIVTYFLHTCGELCLSPVGLSSITKLAPADRVGQMMGVWFVASALGNLFAGLVAGALQEQMGIEIPFVFGRHAIEHPRRVGNVMRQPVANMRGQPQR